VLGRWEAHPPEVVDFDRGLVMFDESFAGVRHMERNYRLELRVRPSPPWSGHARFEGRFRLQNGVRLSADWADVRAMAQGADHLFLLMTDRNGAVITQHRVDRSLFDGFSGEAARLLLETSEMAREFQTRCQSTATGDILF
jgi:hypothetical protein